MRHRLGFVTLLASVAACHDATGLDSRFVSAHARWNAHAPASYELTVAHNCFCPEEATGPVRVSVRNGAVVSRRYVRTGVDVPASYVERFPDVEGLFSAILAAHARHASTVDVRYDDALGFPTRIDIDNIRDAVDDEEQYLATLEIR